MKILSTREAAKKLGINAGTLSRYIARKKVPAPKTVRLGNLKVHAWSEKDIEAVRDLLPKIENGRHTRYKKQRKKTRSRKTSKRATPGVSPPNVP
jgi:excisionase family DNA binding protein